MYYIGSITLHLKAGLLPEDDDPIARDLSIAIEKSLAALKDEFPGMQVSWFIQRAEDTGGASGGGGGEGKSLTINH